MKKLLFVLLLCSTVFGNFIWDHDEFSAHNTWDIGENAVRGKALYFVTIDGTSLTDGTATLTGGNLTGMGNITGSDIDISAGTGDYSSSGTITSGNITILSATPILVFRDSDSLGAASVGYIEWRDSGGGRAGFLGNNSSGNDDLFWKNEQGGNIGIQTTGAGKFQIFANVELNNNSITGMGNITGTDIDIEAGTGDFNSTGTIDAGAIMGTITAGAAITGTATSGAIGVAGSSDTGIGVTGLVITGIAGSFGQTGVTGSPLLQLNQTNVSNTGNLITAINNLIDRFTVSSLGVIATLSATGKSLQLYHNDSGGFLDVSAGNFTIDIPGVINLDSGTGLWQYKQGGTFVGAFFSSLSDDQFGFFTTDASGNQLILGNSSHYPQDYDHAVQTNPTLYIHSDTAPDDANDEWISFIHNKTDALIQTGSGDLNLIPTGSVTAGDGTNEIIVSSSGDLSFAGTAELIIPSSTTLPGTTNVGSLYLDTDAGANGTIYMYANGGWRVVIALP